MNFNLLSLFPIHSKPNIITLTFIFTFIIPLTTYAANHDLRILYWNIEKNQANDSLFQENETYPLFENIDKAITEYAPDIIILSENLMNQEYQDCSLGDHTSMSDLYGYTYLSEYNDQYTKFGIGIYSKHPIDVHEESLDFIPSHLDDAEKEELLATYRSIYEGDFKSFSRKFIEISLDLNGESYKIYPIHLLNPWIRLKEYLIENAKIKILEEENAKAYIVKEILYGKENPLFFQIENFLRMIKEEETDSSTVILGDFNVPKSIAKIQSEGYQLMTSSYTDAFYNNNDSTFPTPDAEEFGTMPEFKLDHAFVCDETYVHQAQVLKLQGSDHWPIMVDISTADKASGE